jgi:hypothetical protein
MRRSRLDFIRIYRLLRSFLRNKISQFSSECEKHRGRPHTYDDTLIIALWLFQTLWRLSYRETLETVSKVGFSVPALSTYHYRIRKIPISVLQELLEQTREAVFRRHKGKWQSLMVDGTGYGFRDRYALKWFRGTEVRLVQSHVRLVLLVVVDDKGKAVVLGGAVGSPYASEVELLRRILARKSALPSLPLVGDRVYDSIDLLQQIQKLGAQPAIRIKTTWCYSIRHQLRQISHRGWEKWGSQRYRIEGVSGSIKIKVNSVFPLFREDLAMKRALAAAVLYNLNLLAILTIILIKAHIIICFLFIPPISTSLHIFEHSPTEHTENT